MKKIITLLLLCSVLYANRVEFKENNISNSTVIIFNGKKFDLTKSEFFDYIKKFPSIEKNLIAYFGKGFDKLNSNDQEMMKMLKKLTNKQDSSQLQSKLDKMIKEREKLLEIIEKLETENNDFKPILTKAKTLLENYQYQKYHEILKAFRKKSKEQREKSRKSEAQSAYLEAKEYRSRLEYKDAQDMYAEAVELEKENHLYLSEYSTFLWEYGDYPNALTYAKKSLKIMEVIFKDNPNHPSLATSYNNMGTIYYAKGDYPSAIIYTKKSLEIFEILFKKDSPKHPLLIGRYGNLAVIYRDMNRSEMYDKYWLLYLEGQ